MLIKTKCSTSFDIIHKCYSCHWQELAIWRDQDTLIVRILQRLRNARWRSNSKQIFCGYSAFPISGYSLKKSGGGKGGPEENLNFLHLSILNIQFHSDHNHELFRSSVCTCCNTCVLLYLLYYVCIAGVTLDAKLLARSQYSEGPATGHLDTGFSWFSCVCKPMLRWLLCFQVATTCFSCRPPDLKLNVSVAGFICLLHVKWPLPSGDSPTAVNNNNHNNTNNNNKNNNNNNNNNLKIYLT
jgi:hypothetical protein